MVSKCQGPKIQTSMRSPPNLKALNMRTFLEILQTLHPPRPWTQDSNFLQLPSPWTWDSTGWWCKLPLTWLLRNVWCWKSAFGLVDLNTHTYKKNRCLLVTGLQTVNLITTQRLKEIICAPPTPQKYKPLLFSVSATFVKQGCILTLYWAKKKKKQPYLVTWNGPSCLSVRSSHLK